MEQQEIKTLKLFEALDENGSQSQRELSKKLDISLGLVNALLKRIVNRGFFKVVTADKNKISYILTPKGITEKTVLTYRYIVHSIKYYDDTRKKVKTLFEDLLQDNVRNLLILGANELAEIAYITAKESNLNLLAIIDEKAIGERFLDMQIHDIDYAHTLPYDMILITATEDSNRIKKLLLENGIRNDKIAEMMTGY